MNNTPLNRALIVDDEPNMATMVATFLEDMKGYTFETANNAEEALVKLQENHYTLLITDYNMPGMNGLDLVQIVRQISPKTQAILMTAYGEQLRKTIKSLNLDGYINKPATQVEIREIVRQAVERAQTKTGPDPYRAGTQVANEAVQEQLKSLRVNTGARCVLLISSSGYSVSVVGETKDLDITNVSALVAANFLAATELANLLGSDGSMFKSSYHEGNDYNIYSYDVNGELLIAVIFGLESKPGVVWFYTKQTAAELEPLVANQTSQFTFEEEDMSAALDAGFNELFGDDDMSTNQDFSNNGVSLFANETAIQKPLAEQPNKQNNKPMTFEQAIAAGLVPAKILQKEQI